VKLEKRIPRYSPLFCSAAAVLSQRGASFFVVSEQQLRKARLHRDARLVLRYAKASYPQQDVDKVVGYLQTVPAALSIAELCERLQVTRELLLHLTALRKITFAAGVGTADSTLLKATQSSEFNNALHLARWFSVSPWRANA
jgi:hypothetical protein